MALTTRQWKLYEFLKGRSDDWTTQREIYEALKEEYEAFTGIGDFHNAPTRVQITNDIRALNDSDVIQKIVLSSSSGVKISSEAEYKEWSVARWNSLKGMIKRLAYKDQKAKLNGQMKLVFGESLARDFYEAFPVVAKRDYEKLYDVFSSNGSGAIVRQVYIEQVIDTLTQVGKYNESLSDYELMDEYQALLDGGYL